MESRFGGFDENEKNDSLMLESPPPQKKSYLEINIQEERKTQGRSTVKELRYSQVDEEDDSF